MAWSAWDLPVAGAIGYDGVVGFIGYPRVRLRTRTGPATEWYKGGYTTSTEQDSAMCALKSVAQYFAVYTNGRWYTQETGGCRTVPLLLHRPLRRNWTVLLVIIRCLGDSLRHTIRVGSMRWTSGVRTSLISQVECTSSWIGPLHNTWSWRNESRAVQG